MRTKLVAIHDDRLCLGVPPPGRLFAIVMLGPDALVRTRKAAVGPRWGWEAIVALYVTAGGPNLPELVIQRPDGIDHLWLRPSWGRYRAGDVAATNAFLTLLAARSEVRARLSDPPWCRRAHASIASAGDRLRSTADRAQAGLVGPIAPVGSALEVFGDLASS